jgi:hypothetical protein
MAAVEKMSLEELQRLIDDRIDARLTVALGKIGSDDQNLFADNEPDARSWEQVKQDIERNRWTPPPGARSSLELLREERDK